MNVKNKDGDDVTVRIGLSNYRKDKEVPFVVHQPPSTYIILNPNPSENSDMNWGDIIKWTFLNLVGIKYKPEAGWFEIDGYSTQEDFKLNKSRFEAPLTNKTSELQDKILIEEKPFNIGFTATKKEERTFLGFTHWKVVSKKTYIFKVNPKGLIRQEDKE